MRPVYILEAQRTAIGRFGGGFKDLASAELATLLGKSMKLGERIDQVILGQVLQAGSGMNVARQAGLKLGLPQEVPGYTVNMACGSSLKRSSTPPLGLSPVTRVSYA